MITHKEYVERLDMMLFETRYSPHDEKFKAITDLMVEVVGESSNGWDEKYDKAKEEILKTLKGE